MMMMMFVCLFDVAAVSQPVCCYIYLDNIVPSFMHAVQSKLPKSAGTFAGRESYKRPSKNTVSQIV